MAVISRSRPTAIEDDEAGQLKMFQEAMHHSIMYPDNLDPSHTMEKAKFVGDFRRHFNETKNDMLLVLSQNSKRFRRLLIQKRIRVEFHDAGLGPNSNPIPPWERPTTTPSPSIAVEIGLAKRFASSWELSKDDTDAYYVNSSEQLEGAFAINSLDSTTNPRRAGSGAPSSADRSGLGLRADPVCRFMCVTLL